MIIDHPSTSDSSYIYIETPKCGSRSVVKAIKHTYGTRHCEGHKTLKYVLDWCARKRIYRDFQAVVVFRNPYERFLSALNYVHMAKPKTLEEHLKYGVEGKSRYGKVFTTQLSWVDTNEVPVHYFSNLSSAMTFMGLPDTYHENASDKHFKMSDLESCVDFIEDTYREDILFWDTLVKERYIYRP